jgi:hypothetical protein
MTGINWTRLLSGGVIAGFIMLLAEMSVHLFAGVEWTDRMQELGLPQPGGTTMIAMLGAALLRGTIAMWLYAVASTRLGAKMETACQVGLAVWGVTCLIPNIEMASLGIIPARLFVTGSAIGFLMIPVAVCAGSFVYREQRGASVRELGSRAV